MYILTCKMCGKAFEAKGSNAKYCKPCKTEIRKAKNYERNRKKRITSVAWGIERLSEPVTKSMKRLREISKYGIHYYTAKDKYEEDKRDKGKIKKLP